jgi:uncharacterized protein (DUF1697 family)
MPVFVVLLRGVNVGKGPRVPMAQFAALLRAQGQRDVKTLLNSGNAVFRSRAAGAQAHARRIEAALEGALGVSVRTVVLGADRLAGIIAANPFEVPDPARLLVAFADGPALHRLEPIGALTEPPEAFHLGKHAAYLHCAGGIRESRAAAALLAGKAGTVTTRNWATTLKLHALAQALGA